MSAKQNIYLQLAGVVKSGKGPLGFSKGVREASQHLGSGALTDMGAGKGTQARRLKDYHSIQWQQAQLPSH